MARIQVVVAETSPDIEAEGIGTAVENCIDMRLAGGRVVSVSEIDALLAAIPQDPPCVLVLLGPDKATELAERRFSRRPGLVVIRVNTPYGNLVRTSFTDIGLQGLLDQIRVLAEPNRAMAEGPRTTIASGVPLQAEGALLRAGIAWIHATLRQALAGTGGGHGDLPGLTVAPARVVEQLDHSGTVDQADEPLREADALLDRALAAASRRDEPLAAVVAAMDLSPIELRVLLLALAPELDPRYQRCIGVLMDDLGRRVGTLGLCTALLGDPIDVRFKLEGTGNLARWRVFDLRAGLLPPADEPLRLDPSLVAWILGDSDALLRDPLVRRLCRLSTWAGGELISASAMQERAAGLVRPLIANAQPQWLLFAGNDAPAWRAVLELGAQASGAPLIRLQGVRIPTLDSGDIEEASVRIGRSALLSGRPLVIDLAEVDAGPEVDDALRRFLTGLGRSGCRAGLVFADAPRLARLLGTMPFERMEEPALPQRAHAGAVGEAARRAGVGLTQAQAGDVVRRFALPIDGIHRAMRLASTAASGAWSQEQRLESFLGACRHVASERVSRMAERIEPVFSLDDVVLPSNRKEQLAEIVDNVLLSDRVLDEWAFGDQLPYGRGVTVLFHGPSGTGKTMAALAVARQLGIQILRIDLSRVVSKYIGDTEKNIDRVFEDAQRSGSALLIDEADALLGKRSEVKDAHDRYANIEVAYLLQRMEAYEGLAILTTNLRQNLDAAFLRRLRFIIDFPRPDAEARESIWRRCLPERARGALDEAAFRLLGRRVDLTGGHIRQITLRAAFMAAAAGTKIDLSHIARATNAELAKLGMPPIQLEAEMRKVA